MSEDPCFCQVKPDFLSHASSVSGSGAWTLLRATDMLLFVTVSLTLKKRLVASRKAVCVSSSPSTVVLQYACSEQPSSSVSGPGVGGVTYLLTKHGP